MSLRNERQAHVAWNPRTVRKPERTGPTLHLDYPETRPIVSLPPKPATPKRKPRAPWDERITRSTWRAFLFAGCLVAWELIRAAYGLVA